MDEDQKDQPTIFLLEEDDETRPLLRRNLQKDGYRVLLALDEEDALNRLGGGQVRFDLILVNLIGKTTEECLRVGRVIREQGRYDGHTPLIVMPEKYGEDLEGQDLNVAPHDWITYPEDAEQLHRLIARLTARDKPATPDLKTITPGDED